MLNIMTLPNCTKCDRTKKLLDANNIPYTVTNLAEHPETRAKLKANGMTEAPVIENHDGTLLTYRDLRTIIRENK